MQQYTEAFVGIDTAKKKHALAIADPGRDGETRYLGEIDSAPAAVQRMIRKLARRYEKLSSTASATRSSGVTEILLASLVACLPGWFCPMTAAASRKIVRSPASAAPILTWLANNMMMNDCAMSDSDHPSNFYKIRLGFEQVNGYLILTSQKGL